MNTDIKTDLPLMMIRMSLFYVFNTHIIILYSESFQLTVLIWFKCKV